MALITVGITSALKSKHLLFDRDECIVLDDNPAYVEYLKDHLKCILGMSMSALDEKYVVQTYASMCSCLDTSYFIRCCDSDHFCVFMSEVDYGAFEYFINLMPSCYFSRYSKLQLFVIAAGISSLLYDSISSDESFEYVTQLTLGLCNPLLHVPVDTISEHMCKGLKYLSDRCAHFGKTPSSFDASSARHVIMDLRS